MQTKPTQRLRRKAPGLSIIAIVGFYQSFVAIYVLDDHPAEWHAAFASLNSAWPFVKYPLYYFNIWLACYVLVDFVQRRKFSLVFFENFTDRKGMALAFLGSATIFWKNFLINFHGAFDVSSPFLYVVGAQIGFILICIIYSAFVLALFFKRRPLTKLEMKRVQYAKDMWPNVLWGRAFFREMRADNLGKMISCVVGIGYLIFFYGMMVSIATPRSLAVTTAGTTIDAHDVRYAWLSKYHSGRGLYCLLDLNAKNRRLEFALNKCPACAREPGSDVIVTHHLFNYLDRRFSTVECVGGYQ